MKKRHHPRAKASSAETPIPPPPAFQSLAGLFGENRNVRDSSLRDLIFDAIGEDNRRGAVALRDYIDALLAGGVADAELRRLWMRNGPRVWLRSDAAYRTFSISVRDAINTELASKKGATKRHS